MGRLTAVAQERKELKPFAQAAAHHLRSNGGNFRRAEVKTPVEILHRMENLGVRQVRIMQRRHLDAVGVDQLGVLLVEPAVLQRLAVKFGAGIRRGQRDLNGMGIDLAGEANGFLDGFAALAGKPENKRAVNGETELVAILSEAPGDLNAHALADVVQY